ncbi:pantoate--beta-alanine ligase [Desulfovulcanus sp.]
MKIISDVHKLQQVCLDLRSQGLKIALVPTMGYFHEGHLSLMRWARQNCDQLIVSLFVNPTQFAPHEDLEAYPRDLERDKDLAQKEGVDILFTPSPEDLYLPGHSTWVEVPDLARNLCGASRPTHFRGVATIVCKLFNLILPHVAVFGQKDWQQLTIIKRMVKDLNLPIDVVGRPIVREPDGLAMSSRNAYLSLTERKQACFIYKGLLMAQTMVKDTYEQAETIKRALKEFYQKNIPDGRIDYIELVHPEQLTPVSLIDQPTLLAVAIYLGKARLIDNILLEK